MQESKRLLVTTDGSSHSQLILPHAAAFAQALEAETVVLQVIEPQEVIREEGESEEGAARRALEDARSEVEAVLKRAGIEATPRAELRRDGEDTAEAILRAAAETDAALIAMQSRGHGAVRTAILGSVSTKVLGRSPSPVMVGGENLGLAPAVEGPYQILATSDGSVASNDIVRDLRAIVVTPRFRVTLMRVYEPLAAHGDEESRIKACEEQLQELAALFSADVPVETYVRRIAALGGVDTAIVEHAKEVSASSIALSTHGGTGRREALLGGVASLLLSRSPLPLILSRG
jgi:nucleotide-binding universal stress UspA family protein